MVDGCRSKLLDVVSRVPQVSDLAVLLPLLYTSELFSVLENKLIGYADDSILMAVVPYLLALELQYQSPLSVTLAGLVNSVTFGE